MYRGLNSFNFLIVLINKLNDFRNSALTRLNCGEYLQHKLIQRQGILFQGTRQTYNKMFGKLPSPLGILRKKQQPTLMR